MDDIHKKLKRWWQLCNSNTIDHIPSDFEWWDEIDNFIKDPDAALEAQEVIAGELEESMQEFIKEEKKKEKFTNCFGLEMEREITVKHEKKNKNTDGANSE